MLKKLVGLLLLNFIAFFAVASETDTYDLSKDKVLYTVGYAHLDTQWRWDYKTTVEKYIKKTLDDNFKLLEKYPEYVFSFTGSRRYQMMKEYYPEKYEKLKKYIANGRWFVSGSSVDECDVLVPSSESIIRQVLYGNDYFRKEFGKESVDFMLPDCFGFPASLPSVWAHCGLIGFSSQKLTWGSAMGIPFDVGVWQGPDGRSVIAALRPGNYTGSVDDRLDVDKKMVDMVNDTGNKTGVYAGYRYYGVGDVGGAPRENDVKNCLKSLNNPDSILKVELVSSDQMYKDITDEQKKRLPRYAGDMLLIEHSAATLTSQAYMKRWNRKNEQLADSAERAAVAAMWLGGADYPLGKINRGWNRVLSSQMHDILPGTSIPKAYEYSWNDEVIALNNFSACLENASGTVSRVLDTKVKGQPVVVYNPLEITRQDIVEATVDFIDTAPRQVRVYNSKGSQVPSQVIARNGNKLKIVFLAEVPSVGFEVYDVREASSFCNLKTNLKVTTDEIENDYYKVKVNSNGDIASIYDKKASKELLASPARLEFQREVPIEWPAWNMYWKDRCLPPADHVRGPAKINIIENGPARVAIEIVREHKDSIFAQQLRLSAGDAGSRVELKNYVDWQTSGYSLKAAFPLTVSNSNATYNLTMGTIERCTNCPIKFEVPSHQWFDLTDRNGDYGVTVLEDCKYGSDKPCDNVVRLTLLHTPLARTFCDQGTQDWGRHEFIYALFGHKNTCQQARSYWQGRRVNQPLVAFQPPRHKGKLGKAFSLFDLNTDQVGVSAVKKAENSDYIIVRLQELMGKEANGVAVSFASSIVDAYEVDGQERKIGIANVEKGDLIVDMTKFSPRSFALKLDSSPVKLCLPQNKTIALDYNTDVFSFNSNKKDGNIDKSNRTIPAEMLPEKIVSEDIIFQLGPKTDGQNNALSCKGQTIKLPQGKFNKLYLLAVAEDDTFAEFTVGDVKNTLGVQKWTGYVGQFDNRIWQGNYQKVVGFEKGYIKRDNIAWYCSHRHNPNGNDDTYNFSYIFKYALDVPEGAEKLVLPDNEKIKIFAITVSENYNDDTKPAQKLYDDFSDRGDLALRVNTDLEYLKDNQPTADVIIDRKADHKSLKMGEPVDDDFADTNSDNGVIVDYLEELGFSKPCRPWRGFKGEHVGRLLDGQYSQNDDDLKRCVWFSGHTRILVDLRQNVDISKINIYSQHQEIKATQKYTLWGSNELDPKFELEIEGQKNNQWKYIAEVDTTILGNGQIHGVSVRPFEGQVMRYRYLMWDILEPSSGTFFSEIDVCKAK